MRTITLKKCPRVSQLRFSPDGRRLVAVGVPQASVVAAAVAVDVVTGDELHRVEQLGRCGVVTPCATRYVVGGACDFGRGLPFQGTTLPPPDDGVWWPVAELDGYPTAFGVACDHTGKVFALGYGRNVRPAGGHVRWGYALDVVRANNARVARVTVQGPPCVLAFDRTGTRLAVTGGPQGEPRVDVFELPSGKQILAFAPPAARTTALGYHPDGRLVLATGWKVHVHPPDGHYRALELGGHKGQINGLAVGPDGGRLLSASSDGTVREWDADTGREVRVFGWQIGPVTAVAFAPDGMTCAAAGKGGQLVLWDADG